MLYFPTSDALKKSDLAKTSEWISGKLYLSGFMQQQQPGGKTTSSTAQAQTLETTQNKRQICPLQRTYIHIEWNFKWMEKVLGSPP